MPAPGARTTFGWLLLSGGMKVCKSSPPSPCYRRLSLSGRNPCAAGSPCRRTALAGPSLAGPGPARCAGRVVSRGAHPRRRRLPFAQPFLRHNLCARSRHEGRCHPGNARRHGARCHRRPRPVAGFLLGTRGAPDRPAPERRPVLRNRLSADDALGPGKQQCRPVRAERRRPAQWLRRR